MSDTAYSSTKKPCSSIQKSQISNYDRQIFSAENLLAGENNQLEKAKLRYSDAITANDSYKAGLANLDIQKSRSKIAEYEKNIRITESSKNKLLNSCDFESKSKAKKKTCSSIEKSSMQILANQYSRQQAIKRIAYQFIRENQFAAADAFTRGQLSRAAQANINIQRYAQDYNEADGQAALIKNEFKQINDGCLNSGISLPATYVPPSENSNAENNSPKPPTTEVNPANVCDSANCIPKIWNGDAAQIPGIGTGLVAYAQESFDSDIPISCVQNGKINRGNLSEPVKNARIFMAFTADKNWTTKTLTIPEVLIPTAYDFFLTSSLIKNYKSPIETVSWKNMSTFPSSVPSKGNRQIDFIQGITIYKLQKHLCDTIIPRPKNLKALYSDEIKGVGFYYLAEKSNGDLLAIFLGGFPAEALDTPSIEITSLDYVRERDEISYTVKVSNVYARTFRVETASNGAIIGTIPTFGQICVRFDGASNTQKCNELSVRWNREFNWTLSVSNLSAGTHKLEVFMLESSSTNSTYSSRVFIK